MTALQKERFEAIFSRGVCDHTVPGVGQVPMRATWLRYGVRSGQLGLGEQEFAGAA